MCVRLKRFLRANEGVGLVYIAIAVVIISIIISGIVSRGDSNKKYKNAKHNQEKLKYVSEALNSFISTNKRLPIPARISSDISLTDQYNYDEDASNSVIITRDGQDILVGAIPAKALLINPDFAKDIYGNNFIYAVYKDYTNSFSTYSDNYGVPVLDYKVKTACNSNSDCKYSNCNNSVCEADFSYKAFIIYSNGGFDPNNLLSCDNTRNDFINCDYTNSANYFISDYKSNSKKIDSMQKYGIDLGDIPICDAVLEELVWSESGGWQCLALDDHIANLPDSNNKIVVNAIEFTTIPYPQGLTADERLKSGCLVSQCKKMTLYYDDAEPDDVLTTAASGTKRPYWKCEDIKDCIPRGQSACTYGGVGMRYGEITEGDCSHKASPDNKGYSLVQCMSDGSTDIIYEQCGNCNVTSDCASGEFCQDNKCITEKDCTIFHPVTGLSQALTSGGLFQYNNDSSGTTYYDPVTGSNIGGCDKIIVNKYCLNGKVLDYNGSFLDVASSYNPSSSSLGLSGNYCKNGNYAKYRDIYQALNNCYCSNSTHKCIIANNQIDDSYNIDSPQTKCE